MNTFICPACGTENIEGADRCENCMTGLRNLDVPRADATGGVVRSVMETTVGELKHDEPLTLAASATTDDAVRAMRDPTNNGTHNCVLVIGDDRLIGMLTEQAVIDALSRGVPTRVESLMTLSPETLSESDTVAAALNRMAIDRLRCVPIQKDDGGFSILTTANVLRYIAGEDW
ncbi:MAG: CBS domain-containing protein [Pyrinomonadaceae bacterium MAG19_C2-C3]|nr:CBS domain-containing protein [Pyrinomonadaceae bacterium MAG19_C2-C3]